MNWLDALLDRGNEARRQAEPRAVTPRPLQIQAAPEPSQRVLKTVWFQVRPRRNGDMGAAEPGFYFIANGVLTMCSEDGKPTGKVHRLEPGEDPRPIAGRFAREAWLKVAGRSDFNRRLEYSHACWR